MKILVIDIQVGITDERLYHFPSFIQNTKRIIESARLYNHEVIYIQHDDGIGTGFSIGDEEFAIYDEIKPKEKEKVFIKTKNSAFSNKDLAFYLQQSDEDTLIIMGLQTDLCIDATIKSAYERGYQIIVPQGTNSTFSNHYLTHEQIYHYFNEYIWPNRYVKCLSVEQVIKLMEE